VNPSAPRPTRFAAIAAAVLSMGGAVLAPASAQAQSRTEVAAIPAIDQSEWDAANARLGAAVAAKQTALLVPLATKALRIAERTFGPNARETLVSVRALADTHFAQGRFAAAAPLYERFIRASETEDDRIITTDSGRVEAVYNLALSYRQLGRYAQAAPLFERAIAINARWMGVGHADTLRLTSAQVANLLGDPALAPQALDRARTLAAKMRAARDAGAAPGLVNELKADQFLNSSVGLFARCDLAGLRAARDPANNLDAFVLLADADWAVAARRPDPALAAEAFGALQDAVVGTASLAVERTAVRLAAERQGPGLGALVAERQALDDRAYRLATAEAEACAVPTSFERTLERTAETQRIDLGVERLNGRLQAEFPAYFTAASKSILDVAAAQRLLGPDEALLLVAPTPYGTQIMALSRTQVAWRRSDWGRARIALAVKRLLFDMGQDVGVDPATARKWIQEGGPGTPFDRKTAYALYGQIVAPVDDVLAGKRHVFIAAGGALTSLPFGVLVTEPPRGGDGDPKALRATRWFADAHALAVIPSVRALQLLREAPAASSPGAVTFAGYGDPTLSGPADHRGAKARKAVPARAIFQAARSAGGGGVANVAVLKSMPSLPGTEVELENMRAAVGAPASSVRLRDQATERAVRSDDLSHVRILAFATHGLMPANSPAPPSPGWCSPRPPRPATPTTAT
jgi:tetratricopeptide (TPR) repeat protein